MWLKVVEFIDDIPAEFVATSMAKVSSCSSGLLILSISYWKQQVGETEHGDLQSTRYFNWQYEID